MSGSMDGTSLLPAPHCEPRLEPGGRSEAVVPHRVARARTRRSGHGTPAGIRRAVRGACVAQTPVAEAHTDTMRFAEQVLRWVLEVLDRRRSVTHLRPFADPLVVSAVATMLAQDLVPGKGLGAANLTRVRQTSAEPGAAEVFALYQRGDRTLAIAGRIESGKDTWRLVALRMY